MTSSAEARRAGIAQGLLLVAVAWFAPLGSVLFAPVLPLIAKHFEAVPDAALLAPMALATPALFVALLSPVAGVVADRLGRKRLLMAAIVLYALAGTAPMWLDDLHAIIASRVFVGVAEAAVMTASTALICDYFEGERRASWLAAQFGSAAAVATICFVLAGALGGLGWRAPFGVYGATILFVPLVALLIWEPARAQSPRPAQAAGPGAVFPWRTAALTSVVTVFAGIMFYVTPVHLSFLLTERGLGEPQTIGLASAVGSLGVVVGAVAFRILSRSRVGILLATAFALSGLGLAMLAGAKGLEGTVAGMFVNNIGCGLSMPVVLAWALSRLPPTHRGRGSGVWTSAFFLGQFASPLAVAAAIGAAGGLGPAMGLLGSLALAATLLTAALAFGGRAMATPAAGSVAAVPMH